MTVIAEKIVELYLNEEWSDVRIIIDGEDLPAHRIVLVQRCPFFNNMFKSSFSESISNRIELKDTPVNGFKAILKWIYTGEIKFELMDDALDVLRLAHMYEIAELVNLVILYLKDKIVYDNAIVVLNTSVLLSLDELTDYVSDIIAECPIPLLNHDTFVQLSIDALNVILSDSVPHVSDINIFRAVTRWMKANPSKSAHFPDVIKNVPLKDIRFGEFVAVSDILDANVLMKATVEQDKEALPRRKLRDQNVALPKYGVNVVAGGGTSFFSSPCAGEVLRHTSEEGIVVDLGHCFKLNSFKMQLVKTGRRNFSYWIDVSEDNANWTRVIDHSNYICRGLQKLYFKTRPVRYVRICGTSPNDGAFEISSLKAFYTTEPFKIDPETTLLIPFNNVALAKKMLLPFKAQTRMHLLTARSKAILIDMVLRIQNLERASLCNYLSPICLIA